MQIENKILTVEGLSFDETAKFYTMPDGMQFVEIGDKVRDLLPKNSNEIHSSLNVYVTIRNGNDILWLGLFLESCVNIEHSYYVDFNISVTYMSAYRGDKRFLKNGSQSLFTYLSSLYSVVTQTCYNKSLQFQCPHALLDSDKNREDLFFRLCHEKFASKESKTIVVFPDAGAKKRFKTDYSSVEFHKKREPTTGSITTKMPYETVRKCKRNKRFLIVDDICDGGATFNNIANLILEKNLDAYIGLAVYHGLFSKGIDAIHPGIKEIYCTDSTNLEITHPKLTIFNIARK